MTNKTIKELEKLQKRYKKYGVTFTAIENMLNSCWNGLSEEVAVIGLRMALSGIYGEQEYFTAADVATVTGETVEEVNRRIEENREELMKTGGIIEISSPLKGLFS